MNFIIAISREYGSRGRDIGKMLANELNIAYYDNELLIKTAMDSGLSHSVIINFDEKKSGVRAEVNGEKDAVLSDKVFQAQKETIIEIAKKESAVIVGRAADFILKGKPELFTVFIHAPFEYRINQAIKHYNIDERFAYDTVCMMDRKRSTFYHHYTGNQFGDANNFDLSLDSSIGIEESVKMIKEQVIEKFKLGR